MSEWRDGPTSGASQKSAIGIPWITPLVHCLMPWIILWGQPGPTFGQGLEYIKANYAKYEFRIAMRDQVNLFTSVYMPKDRTKSYPILLTRTPYGVRPYGVDQYRSDLGPSPELARSGYIFAYQDVRGRNQSEGEFINTRPMRSRDNGPRDVDETTDSWDTIEWLIKRLPNNNGKVGMYGISYPGYYTTTALIDAHPALVACSPQAPIADWFIGDDWHHNGALQLTQTIAFFESVGYSRSELPRQHELQVETDVRDAYDFLLQLKTLPEIGQRYKKSNLVYWQELMNHGTYDDYWKARDIRPYLKQIRPAVMTVGGWYDAEDLFGTLETYAQIEANNPRSHNILVMGPWKHSGWSRGDGAVLGNVSFGSKTAEDYRQRFLFPFFECLLKGHGAFDLPKAHVFETGTNVWRDYAEWPPQTVTNVSYYLHDAGRITDEPPAETEDDTAYDDYLSDPAKPVPYTEQFAKGTVVEYMTADQRYAGRRPDVLVYQSDAFEQNTVFAGPIEVELHVSTSGTDSDWVVKLIDVYPNEETPGQQPTGTPPGYQQLVRGDLFRGRFRHSFEQPEPFTPGEPDIVKFTMPDVCHAFRRGHRLMVQIHSSWFPLFDLNPQTFVDIYHARPTDFQKAVQHVYRSADRPSRVQVRVLPPP